MRSETETKLRDVEQALKGQQAKSKQLINGLQKQVEEQSKARVRIILGVVFQPINCDNSYGPVTYRIR